MQRFAGFYWTLPVPWAGFTELPSDPVEAAKVSRTIHYQRETVRHWVKTQKGDLVDEAVFLEIEPDRASDLVTGPLDKLAATCRDKDATLVAVDFSESFGWRGHGPLFERIEAQGIRFVPLPPGPIATEDGIFDPVAHFRAWREIQKTRVLEKATLKQEIKSEIDALYAEALDNQAIADSLNAKGMTTTTGKPWTKDNVRKFRKAR